MVEAVTDHDHNLIGLLERAWEVKLKLNEIVIDCTTIHGGTFRGLRPDPEKVKAIQQMPIPKDIKSIQKTTRIYELSDTVSSKPSDVCECLR